jgi:RNA polymerase sigma factor for flagellar operon FliA
VPCVEDLWREFTVTRSPALRTYLIIHYMGGHVRRIAGRLRAQLPPQVDVDDLVDEAYEGLVHAINTFDPTLHVRFETFSSKRLFGAMRDYLRRIDPVPRLTRTRAKHTATIIDRFTVRNGRPPRNDELRRLLRQSVLAKFRKSCGRDPDTAEQIKLDKIADATFRKFTKEGRPALMISYNGDSRSNSGGGGGHSGSGGDGSDDGDAMASFQARDLHSPLDRAELADLRRWITDGFPRRDRLIIILYYYEQMTMKEIGRTIGCSESRVSQRLESILQCLRARLERTGRECEFYRK